MCHEPQTLPRTGVCEMTWVGASASWRTVPGQMSAYTCIPRFFPIPQSPKPSIRNPAFKHFACLPISSSPHPDSSVTPLPQNDTSCHVQYKLSESLEGRPPAGGSRPSFRASTAMTKHQRSDNRRMALHHPHFDVDVERIRQLADSMFSSPPSFLHNSISDPIRLIRRSTFILPVPHRPKIATILLRAFAPSCHAIAPVRRRMREIPIPRLPDYRFQIPDFTFFLPNLHPWMHVQARDQR